MSKGPRILLFDIESTHLRAPFATLLCIGYKFHGEKKVTILRCGKDSNGFLDDRQLVQDFAEVWNSCDYAVAHYGKRFDWCMINSKLMKYRLPAMAPKRLIDTWRIAKDNMAMHSNRLAAISEYFDVTDRKTPLTFDEWRLAAQGCEKSQRYIAQHCKADVLVLEQVFDVLRPWIKEPTRGLFVDCEPMSCIVCGSDKLQRRGTAPSLTRVYTRLQCQDCGKWQRTVKSEPKRLELTG